MVLGGCRSFLLLVTTNNISCSSDLIYCNSRLYIDKLK